MSDELMTSMLAFAAVAAVVTVTPGMDTMLMLRTAAVSGRWAALACNVGIGLGCLCWASASALGITALLAASEVGFTVLRLAGAAYLAWLGLRTLWRLRRREAPTDPSSTVEPAVPPSARTAFRTGLVTNLLNPKAGVFYLSVLPQFLPAGAAPLPATMALGAVHVGEGLLWCAVLVVLVHQLRSFLARPIVKRRLEQVTAVVFLGFAVRLAAERP